ncbi:MAG: hypothetical protein WAU32_15550 [Thermoanaerobaculia bacterium]|jgi:hypothetical protein
MNRRNHSLLLVAFLCSASAVLSLPLMYRGQTVIDIPEPGQDVALSRLSYKANAFEAKFDSVRLEPKGAAGADPYVANWTFVGSNNDGQMHKVEIWVRLLDPTGKQVAMFSKKCVLPPGSHDQPCAVEMEIKPEIWKTVKSARIVADFLS